MTARVLTKFSADLAHSFELDLKIIKTNIFSKIYDDCFKNVSARVITSFSIDLARCPSF